MARKVSRRRSGWGQIDRRASGRYRARYTVPATGELITLGTFDLRGDAEAALTTVRVDMQRGVWKHPKTITAETFKPYALAWISQRVNNKGEPLRDRTKAEYLRYLDSGLAVFADDRLEEITPARVREWHAARLKVGKTTAAREARLLRAVLNTALDDGHVSKNPVAGSLAQSAAGKKYRPPTEDELAVILSVFERDEPRVKLAVILAAYGGLRLSEWRALRRCDLALDGNRYTVTVSRQAYRTRRLDRSAEKAARGAGEWTVGAPKSAEGVRTVTLPAWATGEVTGHLATYVKRFPESLLFAPPGVAEFMDDKMFYRAWDTAREQLGIKGTVREHDLRAFAGTYYARAGATMRETMALLGHSTTRAAMAYQHAVGDRAGELADRMPAPSKSPNVPASLDAARRDRTGLGA